MSRTYPKTRFQSRSSRSYGNRLRYESRMRDDAGDFDDIGMRDVESAYHYDRKRKKGTF